MSILNTIGNYQPNGFINSNFDFWQRGTSFNLSATGGYSADRWTTGGSATGTYVVSRVAFGTQIEVPNNPKAYLRLLATSISSARDTRQYIEGVGSYANKNVTVSFWGRCVSGTYSAGLGFIQVFGTGGSPSAQVVGASQTVTLTSTWAKYSFTFSLPSIAGKTLGTNLNDYLMFYINTPGTGSFDAHFAQFMINDGTHANDWNLAGTNLGGELVMCQRYFEKSYNTDVAPGTATAIGMVNALDSAYAATQFYGISIPYRVEKRTAPTVVFYHTNGTAGQWLAAGNNSGVKTMSSGGVGTTQLTAQCNGSGMTANAFSNIQGQWTADAEL